MSNYGRYFEFRASPLPEQRGGRYLSPATGTLLPIGAPVGTVAQAVDANGRNLVALSTGHTVPQPGRNGIAVFEWSYNAYAGTDTVLQTPSDFSDIPLSSPIQVVHGTNVKVVLRNRAANTTFMGRTYTDARTFVAPTNLSSLAVGDLLCPGVGDGTSGYWREVTGGEEADAWLYVTSVDTVRGEVEAQMLF